MELTLGIDLGATACAVARQHGAHVEVCSVGEHSTTMPAAVFPRDDGVTLVGEDADRESPYEPALVNRLVASRLDDPGPTVVEGRVYDPLHLAEALLAALVERSAPGAAARQVSLVLTYPLRGGRAIEDLLATAATNVTGAAPVLVPEPVATVARAADRHDLGTDAVLAVVDVGGSSSDVTLVRRTPTSFDLVGEPASLPGFGGTDLDATVLTLVESAIGDVTSMVSTTDVVGMLALRRLRAACRRAKERLSSAPETVVEVALRHARGHVEITRSAFERAVEPDLARVADLVATTIDEAGLVAADLGGLVLTGGSAHIPLLTELLSTRTGLLVTVADEPGLATALGAALFGEGGDVATGEIAAPLAAPPADPSLIPPAAPSLVPPAAPSLVPPAAPSVFPPAVGWDDTGGHEAAVGAAVDGPVDAPVDAPWPWGDAEPGADRTHADAGWDERGPGDPTASAWPASDAARPGNDDARPRSDDGQPRSDDGQPWSDDGQPWSDDGQPWSDEPAPWDDARTSVFAPPADDPGAGGGTSETRPGEAAGAPDAAEWGQTSDAEVRRLRTSDTDPFGSRGGALGHRVVRHGGDDEVDDAWDDDDDDRGSIVDPRILVGGGVVAALALVVGAYGFLSSAGSGDTGLAIVESGITTTTVPGVTEALTNPAPSTSSSAPATTSSSLEDPGDDEESSPPPTDSEITSSPTQPPTTTAPTQPPTTRPSTTTTRPRTTTTRPPSTTTSSTTTTTECDGTPPTTGNPDCPPDDPGPPTLFDLFGWGG